MLDKTLVTGGAGCIGSALCEALLAGGRDVVAVDNLSTGKFEHVRHLLTHPRFRFCQGDILDRAVLDAELHDVSMVYHLAANSNISTTQGGQHDANLEQNTIATYGLLEALHRHAIRKLAFASSSAIYGMPRRLPIPEDEPPRPISLYGATKLGCEGLLSAFQHLHGIQTWIFRFANVVGGRFRRSGRTVISDFIYKLRESPRRLQILGDGRQTKSYLHIDDCIDALLHLVEHAAQPLNVLNVGSADALSVQRIAELVVQTMGLQDVKFEYTGTRQGWPGDVPNVQLDVRAATHLGWQARRNSAEAVAAAIEATLTEMGRVSVA